MFAYISMREVKVHILLIFLTTYSCSLLAQPWVQVGGNLYGEGSWNLAGDAVAMNGDGTVIAIGMPGSDGTTMTKAGKVKIYDLIGSNWVQRGGDIEGEFGLDESGSAVSLSSDGNTVAIGAIKNDHNGDYSGHVRVFRWYDSLWLQIGADINGDSPYDRFGYALDLSSDGNTIAISAPWYDNDFVNQGCIKVFRWRGMDWEQIGNTLKGDFHYYYYGTALKINDDGTRLIVGIPNSDEIDTDRGQVRIYEWGQDQWLQKGQSLNGVEAYEEFGHAIDINKVGDIIVASAEYSNGRGAVRIFKWADDHWKKLGDDLVGEHHLGVFGSSVAINSSGNIVVCGASKHDYGGENSGMVEVYGWSDCNWARIGTRVVGPEAGDELGTTVDVSNLGNSFIAGGPYSNENGTFSGVCQVYTTTDLDSLYNCIEPVPTGIYPNPTISSVHVELFKPFSHVQVTVVNSIGQLVKNKSYLETSEFDVELIGKPGVYIIKILLDNEISIVRRIVKI